MANSFYNVLSEAFLGFVMFIIPAIIYGALIALPSVLILFVQKFSRQHFPNLNLLIVCLTGVSSFVLVLMLITRSIIGLSYTLTIPSAPNWEEKQRFQSAAIDEATYRSLIPVYFQKPCTKTPGVVCQLGDQYSIDLWNSREEINRMPVIGGLVAAIVSLLLGLWAQNLIRIRSLSDHEDMQTA